MILQKKPLFDYNSLSKNLNCSKAYSDLSNISEKVKKENIFTKTFENCEPENEKIDCDSQKENIRNVNFIAKNVTVDAKDVFQKTIEYYMFQNKLLGPSSKAFLSNKLYYLWSKVHEWIANIVSVAYKSFNLHIRIVLFLLITLFIGYDALFLLDLLLHISIIAVILRGIFPVKNSSFSSKRFQPHAIDNKAKISEIGRAYSSSKIKFKKYNISQRFNKHMYNFILLVIYLSHY